MSVPLLMQGKDLTPDEILRYSRHLIMPEVGLEGQGRLKAASVLLVGAGGLGSPAAMYLAAAGVGRLGLVDFDVVDFTNLQRQVIHGTPDVGKPKLQSAQETIEAINPKVHVEPYETLLSSENALDIFRGYDVIVDGTDNFPTRYLVNDACVLLGKPNCYGSIFRFDGQATVFHHPVGENGGTGYGVQGSGPDEDRDRGNRGQGDTGRGGHGVEGTGRQGERGTDSSIADSQSTIRNPQSAIELGPCYRCLYPEPPPPGTVPSCAEGGVLGILPGVIGLIQATEAVKIILGKGESLAGRLLLYDALNMRFRELKIRRDPNCPVCGDHPMVTKLVDYHSFCGVPGHGVNQALYEDEIEPTALRAMAKKGDRYVLIDVREPHEYEINRIEGSKLIPLRDLPERVSELDSADEIVVHCLVGQRSAEACQFLKTAGFKKVRNLRGGIRKWIDDVEPDMVRY
ncbi:MAG: ThiF family adenylyltransferase [Armatimonadetes bacterium]|nr:ThiF family adenylyltransferase [Armatimonadota bacterium]